MTDLSVLDATAQAELVRRGDATPAALVDAAIARIERLNRASLPPGSACGELFRRRPARLVPTKARFVASRWEASAALPTFTSNASPMRQFTGSPSCPTTSSPRS